MRSVQLFAYEIDTHFDANGKSIINTMLENKGANPHEMTQQDYLTMQANLQRDLITRYVVPRIAPDVLPVFLSPEFFFKRHDASPYDRAAFLNSIEYFKELSGEFPEVLWIPGTVWWQEPASSANDNNKAMVHNSALVLQGGRLLHTWQKERLSNIDGLKQGPEIWDRSNAHESRILNDTQTPFFTATIPGGTPATCGIEICLDHVTLPAPPVSHGVLRTLYERSDPTQTGSGVDLHVLVAAGMCIKSENIVSRGGGVFMRCDGGAGANPRSNSVSITRAGASPQAALRAWTPTQVQVAVQTYSGADERNRLAIYSPAAFT